MLDPKGRNLQAFQAQIRLSEPNGVSKKISKQVHFYFFRSDRKRTANGSRTDPKRTPNEFRTDPERTPNKPRTDPVRSPNGPRTNPKRTPNGPRTDSERTPVLLNLLRNTVTHEQGLLGHSLVELLH